MNERTRGSITNRDDRGLPRSFTVPLLSALLAMALGWSAAGQDIGDPVAGRGLAEKWCNSCHVVDPKARDAVSTGAPAFTAVARMSSATPLSLRVFLQTPHERMPDLHLTGDEIDNMIAYILSLRSK